MVVGRDQSETIEKISAIERAENYLFIEAGIKKIHDVYFDTEDGQLAKENFGLRIRRLDDDFLITLKGKPEPRSDGSVTRLEEEFFWGEEARKFIRDFFAKRKIAQAGKLSPPEMSSPQDFFESFGLKIIHQRFNSRRLKNIVDENANDLILLEMALDQMTFPFREIELKLFEIELEQKSAQGGGAINFVKDFLLNRFGDELLLWQFSKLATGIAMQKLIQDDEFLVTIDSDGHLCEDSYRLINDYFLRNQIGVS